MLQNSIKHGPPRYPQNVIDMSYFYFECICTECTEMHTQGFLYVCILQQAKLKRRVYVEGFKRRYKSPFHCFKFMHSFVKCPIVGAEVTEFKILAAPRLITNQSISLIADLRPEGRIANEMQVKQQIKTIKIKTNNIHNIGAVEGMCRVHGWELLFWLLMVNAKVNK